MPKPIELSAKKFVQDWTKQGGAFAAAADIVLLQLNDYEEQLKAADRLAREIHQTLKRGERTDDHGLIGNLRCILDHVCRKDDPKPL